MNVNQTDFTGALLNPDIAAPRGLISPDGRPAGKRFDVYRNTVTFSLMQAMEIAFPVVRKLVGNGFFKSMAAVYVRAHPPKSPILMFYGVDFPAFLADFKHVQTLPYLPDIARLELARRVSYHAADCASIAEDKLAAIAPSDLVSIKLTLTPAMQLLSSDYPIYAIWQTNMADDAPKVAPVGECVLLTRPALDVIMLKIDLATYTFLSALKMNTLGQAFDTALEINRKFDLTNAIDLMLQNNLIIGITP